MRRLARVAVCAALVIGCHGQRGPEDPARVLPLRSVRLYETGVAYFERAGVISGSSALPVPASHVDDALKTLVVLGDGGHASVSGVEFESLVSRGLARSLAALPLDPETPVSYRDVLESLRGVQVELTTRERDAVGTLVEVAAFEQKSGPERLTLTLLENDGSVVRVEAAAIDAIRPTDRLLAARLQSAISALSGRAAQMRRRLDVAARAAAALRLGYVAETPVWRSTYRLVLPKTGTAASLEGWALIHNDTDEAWTDVGVELVNGRPDSFLFPLSAPRYARRPLAEPSEALSTVPQLADTTADQLWGDHVGESAGGVGLTGFGSGGGGYGAGAGRLGGRATTANSLGASSELSIGNLAAVAQSTGVEAGALFSYRLGHRVALRAHGSALLPFTRQAVEARRVSWFEPEETRARSAGRFVNTSAQTLPAGPVAVYAASGFAGETALPRLKPAERAFLQFGVDLDLELETHTARPQDRLERVAFDDGTLVEHFVRHHDVRYELSNRGAEPRAAYVALRIVSNARVTGADELDYDAESARPLAVFRLAAHQNSTRALAIDEALQQKHPLAKLEAAVVARMAEAPALPEAQRQRLRAAARLLELVARHELGRRAAEQDIGRVEGDLKRVREHLAALGDKSGSAAGTNPIVSRLIDLENQLSAARQRVATLSDDKQRDLERAGQELERL